MRFSSFVSFTAAMLFASLAISQQAANPAKPAPAAAPAAAAPAAPAAQSAPATATVAASSEVESGSAAWYGRKMAGRKTASGQRFNPAALTTAHKTLPFGTKIKVTNTRNNRSVVLIVNDRLSAKSNRILDVSYAAAKKLRFVRAGLTEVKLEVVGKVNLKQAKRSKHRVAKK